MAGRVGVAAAAGHPHAPGAECAAQLVGDRELVAAAVDAAALGVDDQRPPRAGDEAGRYMPGEPATARALQAAQQLQRRGELARLGSGAERQCGEQLGEQRPQLVPVGGEQVEMRVGRVGGEPLGLGELGLEAVEPDLALDQHERIDAGLARLEHEPAELHEAPHGLGRLPARAARELVAFALGAAVGGAERAVEDLQRVIAALRQHLDREGGEDRVAAHRLQPPERLRGRAAAELRQPGAAIGRQRGEVELVCAELLAQVGELGELAPQRAGADRGRPRAQPHQRRPARPARRHEQRVERPRAARGELVGEQLVRADVRALACRGDQAHEAVWSRALDPPRAQLLAGQAEQPGGAVVLERPLGQPGRQPRHGGLVGALEAEVVADGDVVLAARLAAQPVVEHRPGRHVELGGEVVERLGGRVRQVGGHKAQQPQRAQLQRDAEPARRAAVVAHEREVVGREREVRGQVVRRDRLGEALQAVELGGRQEPRGHQKSTGSPSTAAARAPVQRCQRHKQRNVEDHLPDRERPWVRALLRKAWANPDHAAALAALKALARQLEKVHPDAAGSLREGLEETLTLTRLGVAGALKRTLCSTNPIESMLSTVRRTQRNVKRWRAGDMRLRWTAAGLAEAQRSFRRIKGHRDLPKLTAAIRREHDPSPTQQTAALRAA